MSSDKIYIGKGIPKNLRHSIRFVRPLYRICLSNLINFMHQQKIEVTQHFIFYPEVLDNIVGIKFHKTWLSEIRRYENLNLPKNITDDLMDIRICFEDCIFEDDLKRCGLCNVNLLKLYMRRHDDKYKLDESNNFVRVLGEMHFIFTYDKRGDYIGDVINIKCRYSKNGDLNQLLQMINLPECIRNYFHVLVRPDHPLVREAPAHGPIREALAHQPVQALEDPVE